MIQTGQYRGAPKPSPHSWPMRRPPSLAMARTCAMLEAQAPVTVRAIMKEITAVNRTVTDEDEAFIEAYFATKRPLIERAREVFQKHGPLIIDELIFALTVANKEVERLGVKNYDELINRHAELLAAAKEALGVYESMHAGIVSPYKLEDCIEHLEAAIAKAEELGS